VDWIISNKNYTKKKHEAVHLLVESLTNTCKNNGNKYTYALIKHDGLIKTYEDLGYTRGDTYTQEMIKAF